jgi:putative Holliday junction resolvase
MASYLDARHLQRRRRYVRILAIDPGDVRVGIAATDSGGMIATPLEVTERRGAADTIAARAQELGATLCVVGLPLNMNGTEGPAAEKARELGEELAERGLEVEYLDERMTTMAAERSLIETGHSRRRRREITDAVAATILLEAYLERRRHQTDHPPSGA